MRRSADLAPALAEAARAVAGVAAGRSLAEAMERRAEGAAGGALADLCYSTLRRYGRVQALVRMLSHKGAADSRLEALLWCALSALDGGRYSDYTVVDQAVRACALLELWPARGYVNGLLRSYLRQRNALERRIASDPQALHQHPLWWVEALERAYPEGWRAIAAAGNMHPPMCLRVNRRRASTVDYLARLQAGGIAARCAGPSGVLLHRPLPVASVPGFDEGEVSVQDAGAQRAAEYLDLAEGQRVLDACAAPGGKSAHILETADIELMALDEDAERAARIETGLARLGLAAQVRVADCTAIDAWWDGRAFNRVLADVPCTGSGVVRRHPDIKWLRRESDVPAFARRQAAILDALWRVLAPGGKLLYVTCSVFPEENGAVVDAFCARTAQVQRRELPGGAPAQLLPGAEHDGFYFALLEKGR
jgi:16S rRNA (cytosine967-C5)-methyltransferase